MSASAAYFTDRCGATIEVARNTFMPCGLKKGHEGPHEPIRLGKQTTSDSPAAKKPRRKLCELILWHDQYDAHRHTPDVAVRVADRSVEEFRRSPWSWYSPREIVQWHGWFA